MASPSWIDKFPQGKLKHHPFTSSDHCQISLNLSQDALFKWPPFCFEKMWCLRKDYDTLVKKTWCNRFEGSHMFKLVNKCKLLKENSNRWNLLQFGNIFRQLRLLHTKLVSLQKKLIDSPCMLLQQQEDRFLKLLWFSREYWKQKSKTKYLKLGDASTKYCHAHVSIRHNRNQIKEFITDYNLTISSPIRISQEITREFHKWFFSNRAPLIKTMISPCFFL